MKKWIRGILLVLTGIVTVIFLIPSDKSMAAGNGSLSKREILEKAIEDKEIALTDNVFMQVDNDQNLYIVSIDKKATSTTRYCDLAWKISEVDSSGKINTKRQAYKIIKENSDFVVIEDKKNGMVYSVFIFLNTDMLNIMKSKDPAWADEIKVLGGTIRFDSVMTWYTVKNPGTSNEIHSYAGTVSAGSNGGIKTTGKVYFRKNNLVENGKIVEYGIEDAKGWANKSGFAPRYGKKYSYKGTATDTKKAGYEKLIGFVDKQDSIEEDVNFLSSSSQYSLQTGIPTTEKVKMTYDMQHSYGAVAYHLVYGQKIVKVNAIISAEVANTSKKVTYEYYLPCNYAYWSIFDYTIFNRKGAFINNGALPGGKMSLNSSLPSAVTFKNNDSGRIGTYSENINITINLGTKNYKLLSDAIAAARKEALTKIGPLKVKQDEITVNGNTILTAKTYTLSGTTATRDINGYDIPKSVWEDVPKMLQEIDRIDHGEGEVAIPTITKNGIYDSKAYFTIQKFTPEGNSTSNQESENSHLNDVEVHTPVVCKLQFPTTAYVNGKLTLAAGQKYSVNFTAAQHKGGLGYGKQTFDKYTSARYIKAEFPMTVNDVAISANTWVSVGKTFTIQVSDSVSTDKSYMFEARTEAINYAAVNAKGNVTTNNNYLGFEANTSISEYAAEQIINLNVTQGYIYDFNIYDVNDYPLWQNVFRKPNSVLETGNKYRAGLYNYMGTKVVSNPKLTLPLLNGSHLAVKNAGALKLGYSFKYSVTTKGNMMGEKDYLEIIPKFYYVKKDGTGKQEVDLYYNETINGTLKHFVKVGSSTDLSNMKATNLGNVYSNVPYDEISNTARLTSKSQSVLKYTNVNSYNYGKIKLPSSLRTFCGSATGLPAAQQDQAIMNTQKWYGEYRLPSETYAVDKGYDITEAARNSDGFTGKENFWLEDGYIIVNFDIKAYRYITSKNTYEIYLQYNDTVRNMWAKEGYTLSKKDNNGKNFTLTYGDVVFYNTIYQRGIKTNADSDFQSGGTH